MAMQRFVNLGGCTVDGSESMWSCDSCHHQWGTSANETDVELSRAMFAYIESVFVPTPPETQRAAQRDRSFQDFVDTVVPQAIVDGASAIQLDGSSIAFVIEGRRILVAGDPFVPQVIEAFQNEMPTDSTDTKTINVYSRERRVELGLARMDGGDGLEISLLGHDLPPEFLADVVSRQRVPVCPYCGKAIRTQNAKQCFDCGMDWHDPFNPFRR
jgi:ribosomal protein L37AE/L43A